MGCVLTIPTVIGDGLIDKSKLGYVITLLPLLVISFAAMTIVGHDDRGKFRPHSIPQNVDIRGIDVAYSSLVRQ